MKINGDKIKKKLSNREFAVLQQIYTYRGLSFDQIWELLFKNTKKENANDGKEYCRKVLGKLKALETIEKVKMERNLHMFFLTTKGVFTLISSLDNSVKIDYRKKSDFTNNYFRASDLRFDNFIARHQFELNQFAIGLVTQNYPVVLNFYHEKAASFLFQGARPDGILQVENKYFFLEQDMSTESVRQLNARWVLYRDYLRQHNPDFEITILFIVKSSTPLSRCNVIKKTLFNNLLDKLDSKFNVYIGTSESIQNYIKHEINMVCGIPDLNSDIPFLFKVFNFKTDYKPESLKFNNIGFDYYSRKLNNLGKIVKENGKIQEYIIDDYYYSPQNVINKITFFESSNNILYQKTGRKFTYVVFCHDLLSMYEDLKLFKICNVPDVVFTTHSLLSSSKELWQAFRTIDQSGNTFKYKDSSCKEIEFDEELSKKAVN